MISKDNQGCTSSRVYTGSHVAAAEHFRLSKWYLDCTDGDGHTVIAYRAELHWRAVHVHYAAVVGDSSSFRESPEPIQLGDTLRWQAPALDLEAEWQAIDPPAECQLLGCIEWNCVMPRARACVRAGGRTIRGLGYAEHLTMTTPPWQLPLRELRWGRFLSEQDGLVWIECLGDEPVMIALHNGVAVEPERLWGLGLEPGRVLREGVLGDGVLGTIPRLRKLLPVRMLDLHESKRLSRGTFDGASGWAVHEVVLWP